MSGVRRLCLSAFVLVAALMTASTALAAPGFDFVHRIPNAEKHVGGSTGDDGGGSSPEIVDLTPDGNTMFSTQGIDGFRAYDVSTPTEAKRIRAYAIPRGEYATSVNVRPDGRYLAVTTKQNAFVPGGFNSGSHVRVYSLPDVVPVREFRLVAGPDGAAFSPDGTKLVVADEDELGAEVELGTVEVLRTVGPPSDWTKQVVTIPDDPDILDKDTVQPEFVDVSPDSTTAAVTLQENNAVAIIDLRPARPTVTDVWSAGRSSQLSMIGGTDGTIDFTEPLFDKNGDRSLGAPRQPDEVGFTADGRHVVLANEGENSFGGRNVTIHALDGTEVADLGRDARFEQFLARRGMFPKDRTDSRGVEPEGIDMGTFGGREYAFVGIERGNAVVVVDVTDPTAPQITDAVPTGGEPEGLIADPKRGYVYTADPGDPTGFSVLKYANRNRSADPRRSVVDLPGHYFDALRGLGVASGSGQLTALANDGPKTEIQTLNLRAPSGEAPVTSAVRLTLDGDGYVPTGPESDVDRDPRTGGWWVAQYIPDSASSALLRVAPDGAVQAIADSGIRFDPDGNPLDEVVGLAVSADGGTLYLALRPAYGAEGDGRLVVRDVASGGQQAYVLPAPQLVRDLAIAPDGALVLAVGVPADDGRAETTELRRAPVSGLADGATITSTLVTTVEQEPLAPTTAPGSTGLVVLPTGETWIVGQRADVQNLGRLFASGGPTPGPALGLPAASTARGLDVAPPPVAELAVAGPRAIAAAVTDFSALNPGVFPTTPAQNVAALDGAGGAPAAWPAVAGGPVTAVAPDGAGGAYLAGGFSAVGGVARAGLAHVRADGSVDPAWTPTTDAPVSVLRRNGSLVYLGGDFTTVGGVARSRLAAVSATTGALVESFADPVITGGVVNTLALDGAGRLYASGRFTRAGGIAHQRLVRVSATTGAIDAGWTPQLQAFSPSQELLVVGDRLFVGGQLQAVNDVEIGGVAAVRTDDAGTLDPAFRIAGYDVGVTVRGLATDGQSLFVAANRRAAGTPIVYLIAVDPASGAPVASFRPRTEYAVGRGGPLAMFRGKLLVTGYTEPIALLDPVTGQPDRAFETTVVDDEGGAVSVAALAVDGDRVLLGGSFDGAGLKRRTFAFDVATGKLDRAWTLGSGEYATTMAVAGDWLYFRSGTTGLLKRASTEDGLVDDDFAIDLGSGADWTLDGTADRLYLAGSFQSVDGEGRRNVAALDAATGSLIAEFAPNPIEPSLLVRVVGDRVYVASTPTVTAQARDRIVTLTAYDAQTGARDPGFGFGPLEQGMAIDDVTADGAGLAVALHNAVTDDAGEVRRLDAATGAVRAGGLSRPTLVPQALLAQGGGLIVGARAGGETPALGTLVPDGRFPGPFSPTLDWTVNDVVGRGSTVVAGGDRGTGAVPGPIAIFDVATPVSAAAPELGGDVRQGATVWCTPGGWDNSPVTYAYAWTRNGNPINGATGATYVPTGADVGAALRCAVTASNDAGDSEVARSQAATVAPALGTGGGGGGGSTSAPSQQSPVPSAPAAPSTPSAPGLPTTGTPTSTPARIRTKVTIDAPRTATRGRRVTVKVTTNARLSGVSLVLQRNGRKAAGRSVDAIARRGGRITVTVPKHAAAGRYQLKLTARDADGRRIAVTAQLVVR